MKMQWVIIWGYFYLKIDCATFERVVSITTLFVIERSSNSKQYSNSKLLFKLLANSFKCTFFDYTSIFC